MVQSKADWDSTADVVVVGYGGAGAAAAIAAADAGADVLILEKSSEGGGNTRLSFGYYYPADRESGVLYIESLKRLESDKLPEEERPVIRAYVDEIRKNIEWISELGGKSELLTFVTPGYPRQPTAAGFPQVPGASSTHQYTLTGGPIRSGITLFRLLSDNVTSRGRLIQVLLETPASALIVDGNGEVAGVLGKQDGRDLRVRARRAVVLACGGFEYAEDLKHEFLPGGPYYALGAETNTGDGIRMASKVGAALWHMRGVAGYPCLKPETHERAFEIVMNTPAFVYVDRHGKRFVNECEIEAHASCLAVTYFDPVNLEYPRIPCYVVFDRTNFEVAPLSPERARDGDWSADNLSELGKGWITKASTVDALAVSLGIEPENLRATLERYDRYCRRGVDEEFGRSTKDLVAMDHPPYYAVRLWPSLLNTQGGPKHNERAQVVDTFGRAIPRLYCAGELGSIWGVLYQSSGNVSEALAFGRLAGKNAAGEKPRS